MKERCWIPAGTGDLLIEDSSKRRAFGETKDPNQVHRDVDGDDDEDEEIFHPHVGGNSVQSDGEGCFTRRRRDDTESRTDNCVEVDRSQVVFADRVHMSSESQRYQVRIDGHRDH